MKKSFFAVALLILCFVSFSFAQSKSPKVLKYVAPKYPPAAKAVRAAGAVVVAVTINKEGQVIEAKAESGHPLLRKVSEISAKDWIFSAAENDEMREVKLTFAYFDDQSSKTDKVKFKKPYRLEIKSSKPTFDY